MTAVTLQPFAADTYINSANVNTNNSGDTLSRVGESDATSDIRRTLMKPDFSVIPAAVNILSATLSMKLAKDESSNARDFKVYRLKRNWVEAQVTWNIYSTGNNWQTAGGFGADDCEQTDIGSRSMTANEAAGWKDWTLTPAKITEMVDGTWANYGFLIKADKESNDCYRFCSRYAVDTSLRPKLALSYELRGFLQHVVLFL